MRFVLIDRLEALELGRRAVATKIFPAGEELFADHFPGHAIVPGTLLTEAMGQTGGWLLLATLQFARVPLLVSIDRARFRRFVAPGERLELEAVVESAQADAFEVVARASVGGRAVAGARLLFRAFDLPSDPGATEPISVWARRTFSALGGDRLIESAPGR